MTLDQMDGLFVGLLDEQELATFNAAVERGEAMRSYEGAAGFRQLYT